MRRLSCGCAWRTRLEDGSLEKVPCQQHDGVKREVCPTCDGACVIDGETCATCHGGGVVATQAVESR